MSANNTALFYPGNPMAFLSKMQKAKRLAIEFKPADKVAQTVTLDVSHFPPVFGQLVESAEKARAAAEKAAAAAARAATIEDNALRAVALTQVHPCEIKKFGSPTTAGDWCWSSGDGHQSVRDTREEAIQSYIESHRKSQ
jgi:hypothetical protein